MVNKKEIISITIGWGEDSDFYEIGRKIFEGDSLREDVITKIEDHSILDNSFQSGFRDRIYNIHGTNNNLLMSIINLPVIITYKFK